MNEAADNLDPYTDSDYAADLRHRRSLTGFLIMLLGGLIAFKTRIQPTIAHSTGEAELSALSTTGKEARYIRHILTGLGAKFTRPTRIWTDNEAARLVSIATGTTKRLRHVDVQAFGIQELRRNGIAEAARVHSSHNLSDLCTKILGITQQSRHILRIFGYHGPQLTKRPKPK